MTLCLIGPCLSTGDSHSMPTAERNAFHRTATLPRPSQFAPSRHLPESSSQLKQQGLQGNGPSTGTLNKQGIIGNECA